MYSQDICLLGILINFVSDRLMKNYFKKFDIWNDFCAQNIFNESYFIQTLMHMYIESHFW